MTIATSIQSGLGSSTFSPAAWEIVKASRGMANKRGSTVVEAIDLLASLSNSKTVEGKALVAQHADYGHVLIYGQCRKEKKSLPFDESNPKSNFTSEARDVLGKACLIADQRGKSIVDEHDLVTVLIDSQYSPDAIQRILKDLNVNLPTFWQSVNSLSA